MKGLCQVSWSGKKLWTVKGETSLNCKETTGQTGFTIRRDSYPNWWQSLSEMANLQMAAWVSLCAWCIKRQNPRIRHYQHQKENGHDISMDAAESPKEIRKDKGHCNHTGADQWVTSMVVGGCFNTLML